LSDLHKNLYEDATRRQNIEFRNFSVVDWTDYLHWSFPIQIL